MMVRIEEEGMKSRQKEVAIKTRKFPAAMRGGSRSGMRQIREHSN